MSRDTESSHTLEKLASERIPIFMERGAENNRQILMCIAMSGSMLKYDVSKKTGITQYSTVSRRIDDLVNRGYLAVASKRLTLRGRQTEESMYGLTWKGFIASIMIRKARNNLIEILRMNPLLGFPEKELVLSLLEEMTTEKEIQTIVDSFLEKLMMSIPNLELIDQSQLPILIISTLPSLKLPKGFGLSKIPKDAWELLDRPAILKVVKRIVVPLVKQYAESMKAMYLFLSAFEGFDEFLANLTPRDHPSREIKREIESRLKKLSETNPKLEKLGSGA